MKELTDNLKELVSNQNKEYLWENHELIQYQLFWYLSLFLFSLTQKYDFPKVSQINSFFHYLFGIPIKLLVIAYLIYILLFKKSLTLNQIGLTSNNYFTDLALGFKVSLPLPILAIILINLQHQHLNFNHLFQPLVKITSFDKLITSFFYFIILILIVIVPALAKELFYRVIIYNFFKERLGIIFGALISSCYYSLASLQFNFGLILSNFLIGGISIYLYERTNNIFPSIIWQSFYQTTTILYIFGF
ncbi:CPBP family intramembrane glutamic endopeptidase [Sporohalobacter salinus]|uniref:CPBP family intramembrane glutamic endopeptidase n=1 Tax=Sporohalobacter salinus TaxID=1494606 RepID=UPI001961CFA7|nr:CPBP family intramembrane glutamic endopeptidase [Sporohalobacter salinus]MBM7624022.1 membrane protease YdiL (CAAX protease family) [Sporohalobacter salinus]